MLVADRLIKNFGSHRAVDDISFTLERGEVLGFLGPNGAGKTTTMRMLAGCLEPDGGSASIAGYDCVAQRLEAQSRLGFLPEGAPAYPAMTPRGFVRFGLRARGFAADAVNRATGLAIERTRLGEAADQPIGTLSKGFKRRAALAAAIAHDPAVLVLDEPTDGLDPNQKDGVRNLIREMAHEKAIIISTHILEEVPAVCSRAMIVARGKILFDGSPKTLAEQGQDHTVESAFRDLTLERPQTRESVV
ncbi:ABC transporter ATP-binding protein [Maricaulis sp.]|uniref:ABC transporter ATP-binding protein n=1 Tax=Maricaulis sp. TaxID=1486257 RepID=UPI001B049A38|nr:ABC transporter ATP-binding protein [Maricaulis sp.]MBO6795820.1 ABC transporter ATP-binding protein [Maricaulis sp.]